MKALPLVAVALLTLASCSLVDTAKVTLQKANETLDAGKQLVAEGKAAYVEAKAAADKDGDGKTSVSEWLAYLALLAGVGGAGGAKMALNARAKTQKELDELYDEVRPAPGATAVRV